MQGPLLQVGSLFPGQAPACPGLQALVAAITETVRTRTRDLNATLKCGPNENDRAHIYRKTESDPPALRREKLAVAWSDRMTFPLWQRIAMSTGTVFTERIAEIMVAHNIRCYII